MYWKYILVNLLLVVPNSRILTSARTENLPELGRSVNTDYTSDEELIDALIAKLSKQESREGYIQPENVDKKNKYAPGHGSSAPDILDLQQAQLQSQAGNPDKDVINSPTNTDVINSPTNTDVINSPTNTDNRKEADPSPKTDKPSQRPEAGQFHAIAAQASPLEQEQEGSENSSRFIDIEDRTFIIIIAVAVSTGFFGLMFAGVCYYRFRRHAKASSDVEYPAYGVTGPMKDRIPSPGDRKLAQSAQMYHYQHQKQQMIAMEKANGDMKHDASEEDSEEDNVEGDYTVYECPGLAPTGEMEIRNPLFRGEETPVTPGQDITGQPHEEHPPPAPERGNL